MVKEIIINRMFSGSYLEDERNIGHEIINLYATDDNNYYVYIVPHGDYASTHKSHDIEAVLMVRGRGSQCVEVISKATGLQPIFDNTYYDNYTHNKKRKVVKDDFSTSIPYPDEYTGWKGLNGGEYDKMGLNDYNELPHLLANKKYNFTIENKNQKKLINNDEKPIKYGKILLDKLFSKNAAEYNMAIYMTFKADSIIKAKKPFYLITKKGIDEIIAKEYISENCYKVNDALYFVINRGNLSSTSTATFYKNEGDQKGNYNLVSDIIFSEEECYKNLWGEKLSPYDKSKVPADETYNFLTLVKKEYDELAYSNMIADFFDKYEILLESFYKMASEKFKEEYKKENKYTINIKNGIINTKVKAKEDSALEENNLDKKDEKTVHREKNNIDILIVDNKNKNVIVIENKIKSGINGERHDLNGDIIETQLDKYHSYVEKTYPSEKGYTKYYFIFVPNYNKIEVDQFTRTGEKAFKPIYFSELLKVFDGCKKEKPEQFENDMYFNDFLKAIKRHSSEYDNNYEEVMKRKMKKLIDSAKTNQ